MLEVALEPELSDSLRMGRRALEGVPGFTLLKDWEWVAAVERWVLQARLSLLVPSEGPIPPSSDWYILVETAYPWGTIKFYPAREGGIAQTFQHQSYNSVSNSAVPWRNGDICLDTTVRVLGRHGFDDEPYDAQERMLWRVRRALEWLHAAAHGALVVSGEPFELPWFPLSPDSRLSISYSEDSRTFALWQSLSDRVGLLDLQKLRSNHLVVTVFRTGNRRSLFDISWGSIIQQQNAPAVGAWIRLDAVPILLPWQVPTTWGEFRHVVQQQGLSLDALLIQATCSLRNPSRNVLLVGFPMPQYIDQPARQMHWSGILLPTLSSGTRTANGFRPKEPGYRQRDRIEVFRDEAAIDWLDSANWHGDEISLRGQLPEALRNRRICLIGAGALGSAMAELLVRSGVQRMILVDSDILTIGNLVRHSLSMSDLGKNKAIALADYLNSISPHATIEAIDASFPFRSEVHLRLLQQCDTILDCTADDAVLHHLSTKVRDAPKLFASFSLGYEAHRLFCFTAYGRNFPFSTFRDQITPWLLRERGEVAGTLFPREGIGCWHPIFPARMDDIQMMATVAIKQLEAVAARESDAPNLVVFEQESAGGICIGLRQVVDEARVE